MECEPPNERLYKFVGNITMETADGPITLPAGPDQLLQRGAQLKNTPWVYGLVVYTGERPCGVERAGLGWVDGDGSGIASVVLL